MVYVDKQKMIDLFGNQEILELTNLDTPSATVINDTKLEASIQYAQDEINSYLAQRYSTELLGSLAANPTIPATVPLVLTSKTGDIARYQLDLKCPREDVRRRYEDVVKWLKLIAKGDIDLGLDGTGAEVAEEENGGIFGAADIQTPERYFTRASTLEADPLEGY